MQPIPMQPMLMPFPCPVVTVTDAHGADAHAANTDAVCGILFWWYSISMAMIPIPMQSIPIPCVASSILMQPIP